MGCKIVPYTGDALKIRDKLTVEAGIDKSYIVNKLYAVESDRGPAWLYINAKGYLHIVIEKARWRIDYLLTPRCTFKEVTRGRLTP